MIWTSITSWRQPPSMTRRLFLSPYMGRSLEGPILTGAAMESLKKAVMIDKQFVEQMAKYNRWQTPIYTLVVTRFPTRTASESEAPSSVPSMPRSITCCGGPHVDASFRWHGKAVRRSQGIGRAYPDWQDLKHERESFDEVILRWAESLDPAWLDGELTWVSGAAHMEITRQKWILVTHMFNINSHRGQVHCMITQCGLRRATRTCHS